MTKYNTGDEVWFIWENKVQRSCITHVTETPIGNLYEFDITYNNYPLVMDESELFHTKEELIKSL